MAAEEPERDINDLAAFYAEVGDVPDAGLRVAELRAAEVRRRRAQKDRDEQRGAT